MNEFKIINDLEPELRDQLAQIHQMLSEIIKRKGTPLSEIWISSAQLRQDLEISPRTEQNWLSEGIIKKHKLKGKIYYRLEEVNAALSQAT